MVESQHIIIGRFGRPHGIKGLITVHSFTEPRDNMLSYADWMIFLNGQWRTVELLETKTQGKHILALVKGFEDRNLCEQLTNKDIAIHASALPELDDDSFYWHELTGMTVVDSTGVTLGVVQELMPTGANDVLVVEGEKRHLIPWLMGRYITSVNRKTRVIQVDWDSEF